MPKKNKFWNMTKTTNDEVEIKIHGDIGESWWGESISSADFVKELQEVAKDAKTIIVGINSAGGSVFDGLAIRSALENHPAHVIVRVEGWAASIASIIAMAGDEIEMALGSMMMIHNPWTFSGGESKELREVADVLDQIRESLVDVYEARTKKSREEIIQMMDEETWMTAKEAVEKGFADRVEHTNLVNAFASANGPIVNGVIMRAFKNAPPLTEQPTNKGDEDVKTVEEFKSKYPELYEEVVNVGVKQEAKRIQAIEEIAKPGFENLVHQAKFEKPMDAPQLAMAMIKAEKERGANYLKDVEGDAEVLNGIEAQATPEENKENKMNIFARGFKSVRGVK